MASPRIQFPLIAPIAAAILLASGCGGSPRRVAAPVASGPPRFLSAADLQRGLGNGFRAGLYRLAVMSQPRDAAPDLGQDLPTGTLLRVVCAPAAARPGAGAPWLWRCAVGWRTVAGQNRRVRYLVRNRAAGCFSAAAEPALPLRRDATIDSYSEHPLNALVSAWKGC